jgi:hypothetical protein
MVVLIIMAVSAAYLLIKGVGQNKRETAASQAASEQVAGAASGEAATPDQAGIPDRVRMHVEITSTDTPAMWTVSSADLVKRQDPVLFSNAEIGDYVLAWKDRVVVYSPTKDRVVGMLMIAPEAASSTTSADSSTEIFQPATTPVSIEIRNASGIAGAAKRLKSDLMKSGLTVDKVADSQIRRTGTLIIDLTNGSAENEIAAIASSTSGTLSTSLPEGEPVTNAGILVLIGR